MIPELECGADATQLTAQPDQLRSMRDWLIRHCG
jgi:hypothetical protein